MQQAVTIPLVDLPGQVQESPLVLRWRLVVGGAGVGGGLDGIAHEVGAGVVDHDRQVIEVATPQKAQVGTVVEGSRLARRIALRVGGG